jgi:Zn-dependent peptidase ImmA (M78 family)
MKTLIKKLLNERLFNKNSKPQTDMLDKFVKFVCGYLKIPPAKVNLKFNREGLVTTASYSSEEIVVYSKDRALVDIMRSITHELVHMKQDVEKRLDQDHDKNNAAGSPIEDEANAKAGEIIRKFGERYPEIYI